ncbi:L-cysteine:1D-myo-inositol 2-amino-2-deoxy-alpha-D-glucopyranoside ligase [Curtobacterium sp. 320]|uniref:cysteine--1-D-myo-inosityl 2-amino-2-deoxy-alpha-D-glucopyranoside ligase n=1 Tax=unclassified Curtobacterium TaxID=257496 RepID=UPI00089DEAFC|nr:MULTISPECIES: cysteine--1-D-myo-inosityl 2-amino-2-deoxy-alpha-D-glucopyranoside ligase [unclassified Curtobacterium]AOX67324.1 cysteine--1-D-myo-inosityl 2-amino-2-deoxy-alpha-D-glucopyranoside ligase [Curtobacterium sp. BH-2-1-1]MDR6572771.1 L-cysteine:1D-myo-inositol 2-amino-2-deoxy-alpha-D-glucopyranoside ligase [Curtobacterium sp. 320]SFF77393.1 L-cysteine:1D-myo-inositol 2-amino-2-deoxy-alpha-D-glucopyranoside ligase [Curtobacterium sp. YR515]
MRAWQVPSVPDVPGTAPRPVVHDTATGKPVDPTGGEERAALYVCGITPYDATHLGHAATYLSFDTLGRVWRDAGFEVEYAQNTTDVDDPLLERAARDGVDWRELAASQIDLFRRDMEALRVLPPDDFVAVTDEVERIAEAVAFLQETGYAYAVPTPESAGDDLYFDVNRPTEAWSLGDESGLDRETMLALSAERGGDPDRAGKRDPLDPLLWRAARAGEPSWDSAVGPGRPGWHIECSVIAGDRLGLPISVQGGGSDLVFPHHEMSAGHAAALAHQPLAQAFVHTGMIAYQGEKISKSLGNLVTVRGLLDDGADPRAIRLALLSHKYSDDWEWFDTELTSATTRLATWDAWASGSDAGHADDAAEVIARVRARVADDLDTPGAVAAVDTAIAGGTAVTPDLVDLVDALLGIRLG